MKIAIVGFGITGSSVLKTLATSNKLTTDDQIDVYEYRDKLASGFPFDDDALTIHMNSYAQDVSCVPDNPDDFINWLAANYPGEYQNDSFVPRSIYGDYIRDHFLPYSQAENVTVITKKITNLRILDVKTGQEVWQATEQGYCYQLQADDNNWMATNYDAVFLCIGSAPYADHYNLLGSKNYIHNPFPAAEVLDKLPTDKRIGVIGSGLTALDIQYHLQNRHDFEHPVTFYIRHQPFTTLKKDRYQREITFSITDDWIHQQKAHHHGQIPLMNIFKQVGTDFADNKIDWPRLLDDYRQGSLAEVKRAISYQDIALKKAHAYLLELTPFMPDLYMSLAADERELFDTRYAKLFQHFRSQIPVERMRLVLDSLDQGQLAFVSGLVEIETTDDGFEIFTEDKRTYYIDILINAAGLELDLEKAGQQDSLIKNLYKQEILVANGNSHALIEWPTCQVMSRRFGTLSNLFLFGSWISNTQYSNNNVGLNLSQGQKSAEFFLEKL